MFPSSTVSAGILCKRDSSPAPGEKQRHSVARSTGLSWTGRGGGLLRSPSALLTILPQARLQKHRAKPQVMRPTGHNQPLLAEGSRDKSGTEPSEHPAQGTGLWHEAASRVPVCCCAHGLLWKTPWGQKSLGNLFSIHVHRTGVRETEDAGKPGKEENDHEKQVDPYRRQEDSAKRPWAAVRQTASTGITAPPGFRSSGRLPGLCESLLLNLGSRERTPLSG